MLNSFQDNDDGRPVEILSQAPSHPSGEPNIIRLKTYLTINEHDRWFAEYRELHRQLGSVTGYQYEALVFKYLLHSWAGPLFAAVKEAGDLPVTKRFVRDAIARAVELFSDVDEPEQPDPK